MSSDSDHANMIPNRNDRQCTKAWEYDKKDYNKILRMFDECKILDNEGYVTNHHKRILGQFYIRYKRLNIPDRFKYKNIGLR